MWGQRGESGREAAGKTRFWVLRVLMLRVR